jgi:glycosyltransferase involved in cell wall biosynthesis
MRVGINEVLIYPEMSGAVNRELTLLPELSRLLVEEGIEPVVYFSREADDDLIGRLTGGVDGVRSVRTPIPSLPTYRRVLQGHRYWPAQARRDGLDLFQTSYHPTPRLHVPTVLTVHDVRLVRLPETYHWARRLFLQAVIPRSLARASKIITGSVDTKNDLMSFFGVPDEKIEICHNPLPAHFERIRDDGILESVRAKYRLPRKYILNVSKIEPRKNIARLIEAYAAVRHRFDVRLVVAGKADATFGRLYEGLRQLGRPEGVVFTGYVDDTDLPALYSMAEVFVYPSIHEGFGIPLLEAMACEVPIVTSNVSALPEIAGDAALLVDPFDAGSITRALERLLGDPGLGEELTARGRKRVSSFTARGAAGKIVEVYNNLLSCSESID